MDELEARLAALEGLVMERLALDPPGVHAQLREAVRGWPDKVQRAQGLAILDDAMRRGDEFTPGVRR